MKIALWLLLPAMLCAAQENSVTAFATFQGLEGRWTIQSAGKALPFPISYEQGSNGSIVTEQFGKELSVFYREGPRLVMIHFCNAGNQPRLQLKKSDQPGVFEFERFDITNLPQAEAAHVERIIYRMIDPRAMDLEIVWQHGPAQKSEKYHLTKI